MTLERLGIHAIERLCDAEPVGFLETLCHGSGFDLVHGIEDVLERELRKHAEIPVQIESAVREVPCNSSTASGIRRFIDMLCRSTKRRRAGSSPSSRSV